VNGNFLSFKPTLTRALGMSREALKGYRRLLRARTVAFAGDKEALEVLSALMTHSFTLSLAYAQ